MSVEVGERRNVDIILDTEFNSELCDFRIEPISIALVTADGFHKLYVVSNEFNLQAAQGHPFLPQHVLPKLPPMKERRSNQEIRERLKGFLTEVVNAAQVNRATFWAKNGGMGDFVLLNLLLEGRLYPFMNGLGVERTYLMDTAQWYNSLGRPKLDIAPIDPVVQHTALGDALHEREFWLACRAIETAGEVTPS